MRVKSYDHLHFSRASAFQFLASPYVMILTGKKNASRRRPGKTTDRGLKKKHDRMTPIEHFLIDIIQV